MTDMLVCLIHCVKRTNSIYPNNLHEVQIRKDYFIYASVGLQDYISQLELLLEDNILTYESGKVIRKICKRSITKMRRKLKSMHELLKKGQVTYKDVYNLWQSWKGYAIKFKAWLTVREMGSLYNRLFIFEEVGYVY
jgi:hypothetical protein